MNVPEMGRFSPVTVLLFTTSGDKPLLCGMKICTIPSESLI